MVRILNGIIALVIVLTVSILLPLTMTDGQPPSVTNSLIVTKNKIDTMNSTSIFDGKTLDGWRMAGSGNFVVTENNTLQSGGQGIFWYTKKKYDNFVLKLDWKVTEKDDNSGVFVRFPDPDNNPRIAVKEGYEIQIDDSSGNPLHKTGAIYDFAPQTKMVSNPAGQWNKMEIRALDQSYTVFINGQKINEFVGNRLAEGYIGLQAHNDESTVLFRNITIKEIPRNNFQN